MPSLFPIEPILPYGFSYYPSFLSEKEEQSLLNAISELDLKTLIFQGFEAKRKVASFGYDYHFDTRKITKGISIPVSLNWLVEKVALWLDMPPACFAEVLVTEYPQGSVINWHRDAPPFDIIVGISLYSNCIFKFRPYDKARRDRKSVISLDVKRCSAYIIRDEAREDWEHSIAPVKDMRYSITLRTLR